MALEVQLLKVDTQEHSNLGGRYMIQSIPTLVIFKDAQEKTRVSGALSSGRLESWIRQNI